MENGTMYLVRVPQTLPVTITGPSLIASCGDLSHLCFLYTIGMINEKLAHIQISSQQKENKDDLKVGKGTINSNVKPRSLLYMG